jgi:hypothetical protein
MSIGNFTFFSANCFYVEPHESRDSCPVLGGRGGEIPPRYSTLTFNLLQAS